MARGVLRLYLGAAPGVGKTYAMLNEGWRRHERGTDIVVGFLEAHGRAQTAAQARDLEVVPRHVIEYRAQTFEEMDIDALLARRPEVALVDELAHTNVPGSRNRKRWQDVEELLDAGITVISTINVQHLESLNDVVAQITGVSQHETVPDAVVRAADQIEIVDIAPEALRRRMAHGNIYAPEMVNTALANYFRVGNLTALRELALLWVADRVDEDLHDYRVRHGIAGQWETKERVMVALTGAPGGGDLIRRAARMAMRTKGELVGVHVVSGDGLSGPATDALADRRSLLEELGGRYVEVAGDDVANALVQAASAENATQLVLGSSRRSRWAELLHGSVINRVIRQAGDSLDVHVVSSSRGGPDPPGGPGRTVPGRLRLAPLPRRRTIAGLALTFGGLPLLTVVLTQFRHSLGLQNALLLYLLVVVAVATIGGLGPGLAASVLGFALLNWFFAAPIHTFTIANGRDLLALFDFLVVAAVISGLVDLATRRRSEAHRARTEAAALARIAAVVLRDPDPLPKLLEDLVATFGLDGAAVLAPSHHGWRAEARAGANPPVSPVEGAVSLPLPGEAALVLGNSTVRAEDDQLLRAFATQLGVALEARRLQGEAANAAALTKANELRTALLAAVSHDLRTPLASIKASATTLLSDDVAFDGPTTHVLLQTIDEEADRLNNLVGNLLDMSRLATGALTVQTRLVGLDEVVAIAVAALPPDAAVELDVPETLPRVVADIGLLERAVANVLDNALTFSPDGQPVRVQAGVVGGRVELQIVDRGCGIAVADRDRVFQPFQRLGDNPNGAGVGLGLAVSKGFIEAMGGELLVDDTPGGGCTMTLSLPRSAS